MAKQSNIPRAPSGRRQAAPKASNKSSNANSKATRDAIFAAAIRHFANFGYEGAHVRKMLKDAGANMALAHYYFGSKESLYEAVIKEFITPVLSDRRKNLEQWRGQDGSGPQRAKDLFVAYLEPHFVNTAGPSGPDYAKLMQRAIATNEKIQLALFDDVYRLRDDYLAELRGLFPKLDAKTAHFIMDALVSIMLSTSHSRFAGSEAPANDSRELAERVAKLLSGGLKAFL